MSLKENKKYIEDLQTSLDSTQDLVQLYGKKVFVAGATGLIGSFLIDTLLYANETRNAKIVIVAHGRSYQRLEARFGQEGEYLEFVIGDVNESIDYVKELDYVIHLASNAYPEKFLYEPVETMLANIQGTGNLLKLTSQNLNCRMLYVSSGEVYGEIDKMKTETDYGYVDVLSSRSCYPMSKRAGETLCCGYMSEYGVQVVIARPCHVYGPCCKEEDNRASSQFIRKAAFGENIILKSKGEQKRSYAYVADCVSGLLTVLIKGVSGQAYNIAPSDFVSIREFAEICIEKTGTQLSFLNTDCMEKGERSPISSQILINEKINELGWKEHFGVKEGIERSIDIVKDLR